MTTLIAMAAWAAQTLGAAGPAAGLAPDSEARLIVKSVEIAAPAEQIYRDWTTAEGLKRVFSPNTVATVEPWPGGRYELEFLNDNPKGERGTEGAVILGIQAARMLSFTWTNRPEMKTRPHRTAVIVNFDPLGSERTRVTLIHIGWGVGPDWDEAYDYFNQAWGHVLEGHRDRMEASD